MNHFQYDTKDSILSWVNILHFYQSPFQHIEIIKEKTVKCYVPVSRIFLQRPEAKAIININGCLLDTIHRKIPEGEELIDNLRSLSSRGQIEITGSGKYHPIFPLIPEEEVRRQITLQEEALLFYFGIQKTPAILFLPELAYLPEQMQIFKEKGYHWVIVDELSVKKPHSPSFTGNSHVKEKDSGIHILVRNRNISEALVHSLLRKYDIRTSKDFAEKARMECGANDFIVTVVNADVYGDENYLDTLKDIYDDSSIRSTSLEDISFFHESPEVKTVPSSRLTTDEDMSQNVFFPLWYHPNNRIHLNLWLLLDLTVEEIRKNGSEYQNAIMDRLLNSCLFYWSSHTPWWNKTMIEKTSDYMVYLLKKTKRHSAESLDAAQFIKRKIYDEVFILEKSGLAKKFQEGFSQKEK